MKRVLVVDDDPDILTLEKRILVKAGFEVVTADGGETAMSLIRDGEFDLILLDIMMPGLNGFEVSRSLRREHSGKSLPVIFVTAKDDADSMREGFRSGGTIFLSKPFTANQLLRVVNSVIQR